MVVVVAVVVVVVNGIWDAMQEQAEVMKASFHIDIGLGFTQGFFWLTFRLNTIGAGAIVIVL